EAAHQLGALVVQVTLHLVAPPLTRSTTPSVRRTPDHPQKVPMYINVSADNISVNPEWPRPPQNLVQSLAAYPPATFREPTMFTYRSPRSR
ncbi:hypothetical protein ACKLTP_18965, partial [Paenarthrobacter ureafaciens]